MSKMSKIVKASIIGIIVLATAVICIPAGKQLRETIQTQKAYNTAIELISIEDYDGALEMLESIDDKDYEDTYTLIKLCRAVNYLEEEDYPSAYLCAIFCKYRNFSDNLQEQIDAVIEEIETEFSAYCERMEEEETTQETQLQIEVPYVGMLESYISKTSLGAPSSTVRHNNEMISGQVYTANLYDFYDGDTLIFTARCVQGKVTQVWDKRDNLTNSTTSGSTKKYSSTTTSDNDPYNADSYSHPDDFYYDHYDDFYDYEEAEAYWEAHN